VAIYLFKPPAWFPEYKYHLPLIGLAIIYTTGKVHRVNHKSNDVGQFTLYKTINKLCLLSLFLTELIPDPKRYYVIWDKLELKRNY